ncbi:MAG: aminotransferase class I/II-fold pyridoxal phosphate-dependent enzyme [Reichenbachiella sp.]
MIQVADRVSEIKEYYFSKKLDEIRAMIADGKDVINLGIGSPDLPPAPEVAEELIRSASDTANHAYQSYRSIPQLREAIASFYQNHYSVTLNPESEILPLLGSKEGVMYVSMAFLNAGDTVLVPNPGYPAYKTAAEMMGAKVVFYDLKEEDGWVPQFDKLDKKVLSDAKLMWVNYPNMPTGKKANKEILKSLSQFAAEQNILVVNDNPYSFILNDNPLSLLALEGSKENCLELNSMSKAFNMAGWRVGMLSGRKEYIDAVLRVKSNVDSGMFRPVQDAAIKALSLPNSWFESVNKEYSERRKLAEEILDVLNCYHDEEQSGMFLWARIPAGRKSEEFVDQILQEQHVFITPGTVFGSNGEGYIRISLCSNKKMFKNVIKRLEKITA